MIIRWLNIDTIARFEQPNRLSDWNRVGEFVLQCVIPAADGAQTVVVYSIRQGTQHCFRVGADISTVLETTVFGWLRSDRRHLSGAVTASVLRQQRYRLQVGCGQRACLDLAHSTRCEMLHYRRNVWNGNGEESHRCCCCNARFVGVFFF